MRKEQRRDREGKIKTWCSRGGHETEELFQTVCNPEPCEKRFLGGKGEALSREFQVSANCTWWGIAYGTLHCIFETSLNSSLICF